MDERKRVAMVTGAGRGIGRAISLALAARGCAVAPTTRTQCEAERITKDLEGAGLTVWVPMLDVTDREACRHAVREVEANLGPVDILVNNAGIAESAPLHRTTDDLWDRHFAVNVFAPFLLARLVAPGMRARGWGRIINIGSTASVKGYPYTTAYTATKHAVLGMTRAMGREWAGEGVTVNCICPGYVDTDMTRNTVSNIVRKTGSTEEEAIAAITAESPLGRLVRPEEVAGGVAMLVDDASGAISGQAIGVCGGVMEG